MSLSSFRFIHHTPLLLVATILTLSACRHSADDDAAEKINGSVHVMSGKPAGPATTVNGGIDVEDNAAVTSAQTVNGGVHLGAHASADSLETVNGTITVGAGAHVARTVESVNGALTLLAGAEVTGSVGNVNGKIEVVGAHLAGGIQTVNGSISVTGNAVVEGGIHIKKNGEVIHFGNDVPRVVIGPGATVKGGLVFERDVKLYVSDRAVIGPVTGATAVPFTGETAPQD